MLPTKNSYSENTSNINNIASNGNIQVTIAPNPSAICSNSSLPMPVNSPGRANEQNVKYPDIKTLQLSEWEQENHEIIPISEQSRSSERFSSSPLCSEAAGNSINSWRLRENHDWQSSYSTIRQRTKCLFNNEVMADVYFLVGGCDMCPSCSIFPNSATYSNEMPSSFTSSGKMSQSLDGSSSSKSCCHSYPLRVPAHKLVLASGSSVFQAMLYGSMAEGQTTDSGCVEIVIPDVEPKAFLNLLRYLYYDCLDMEEDTVVSTLYAAKKYMVPFLARTCISLLLKNLNASNVCILLSHSRLFDETELTQRCWEFLDPQAKEALLSESFVDIDYKTLSAILSRETLTCREIDLFKATQRWSEAECERQNLEITPTNQRTVLGDLLYLIRIPAMRLEEFADSVARSGLLDLKLVTETFLHFTACEKPTLPFMSNPRIGIHPRSCHRFQSAAHRSNQWRYRGRCDSIQFQVNQRIFVAGLGLYGATSKAVEYSVRMELKQERGVILSRIDTSFKSDGSEAVFPVLFEHPVQIEPNLFYTAFVLIEGRELSWFGQEGLSEVVVGNVIFRFQCSPESTNGTGVQGGQIPEIMFYG